MSKKRINYLYVIITFFIFMNVILYLDGILMFHQKLFLYLCVCTIVFGCILLCYIIYIKCSIRKNFEVDQVTGLWNKMGFERAASKVLKNKQKKIFIVDIYAEYFGIYCAIKGFKAGQYLRVTSAKILKRSQNEDILWSRYDDEHYFGLLNVNDKKEAIQHVEGIRKQLLDCEWESNNVVRYKFVLYEIDDTTIPIHELISGVRATLHHIISHHYNAIEILDIGIQSYDRLQKALIDQELLVYIQPQYSSVDSRLVGGEALVRWNEPAKGFLPPDEFIPLFEMHGMIIDLDYYVLDVVCKMLRECLDNGISVVPIAVNFSRVHLFDNDFNKMLQEILYTYNIKEEFIKIEFTETEIVNDTNYSFMKSQIEQLHASGFHVELDDFGSGCTSLDMVCNLSIDVLKLDKGFLNGMQESEARRNIIDSIIQLAHDLNIRTVAEGVETKEQFLYLREMNCDVIQGYYFHPPLPQDLFINILEVS